MVGDPRTAPVDAIVDDRIPRAWILAGRPLRRPLVERIIEVAPANVVIEGRAAEQDSDLAAIARALDGGQDLAGHLETYPAWVVVVEPQWLDRRSLEQISRLSDSDTPMVAITSQPTPELSGLRDAIAPERRRFEEPWMGDEDIESWITSKLGRPLGDTALSELIGASTGGAHLLVLLTTEAARRDMRMPGAADSVPSHPGDAVVEFAQAAFEDLAQQTVAHLRLAAIASIPISAEHRQATFTAGLTDLRGVVPPALAAGISVSLDDVDRRDLAQQLTEVWRTGALSPDEVTQAYLEIGRADPPAAEAVVAAATRWVTTEPARALAALDLLEHTSGTDELRMKALALTGRMTEAAAVADRLLAAGPSPQASLVTAAGLVAGARFRVAAGAYEASDPDDRLRVGAPLLGAPVRAAIGESVTVTNPVTPSLTAAAVSTLAGGASGLVAGREGALSELQDGAELAADTDATLWPDTPHTLGALAMTLDFQHERAAQLLGHGLGNDVGGAAHRSRQRLLAGMVAVRAGRWADAETVVADLSETALGLRDRLALVGLQVALARRSGDVTGLERHLEPAQELVLRHPIDLVSLPAHSEIAIALARMGATRRAGGLMDQIDGFVESLPPRPWQGHAAWVRVVAGLLASDRAWVEAGASGLASPLSDAADALISLSEAPVEDVSLTVDLLEGIGQIHEAALVASAAALGRSDDTGRPLVTTASRLRGLLPGRGREAASGLEALSDREMEVARELIDGRRYKEIGERLFISAKTVEHHVAHIKTKLGATSRSEMISVLRQALG